MTAEEAYACDDTFRLLIDLWEQEKRCPLPLVDRCLELDMEEAADCCRWAATEGMRTSYTNRGYFMYPYPIKCNYAGGVLDSEGKYNCWYVYENKELIFHHRVCDRNVKNILYHNDIIIAEGPPKFAILTLLNRWQTAPSEST